VRVLSLLLISFLVAGATCDAPKAPGSLLPVVRVYEPFVARLEGFAPIGNPFDPAEIAVDLVVSDDAGREYIQPAFWFQDYAYALSDDATEESLKPVGSPAFVARFAPFREGRYTYRWRVTTKGRSEDKPGGSFLASGVRGKGPLTRGDSKRYLKTRDGGCVFLIGHNVAWSTAKAPLTDMLRYYDDMAASGQNCTRLWQCTWGFGIEHDRMGRYDLERAWKLDRLIDRAERHGIYIMFCLENAHDIKEKKSPYWRSEGSPSGLMTETVDFFTNDEIRRAFRNRIRYIVARWGYSPSILAWELFNEIEYTLLGPYEFSMEAREKRYGPWLQEMAAYFGAVDAHEHPITNSLATDRIWDEMNRYPWMDIAQHHTYLTSWDTDGAGVVLQGSRAMQDYAKPYLLTEFGGAPAGVYGQTKNSVHAADPDGVHVHNSLWVSAMSGAAGTAMNWWWDEYIRPNNLYYHYAALHRFLEGTPWSGPKIRPVDLSTNFVRVLALRGDNWGSLWAQNREYNWYRAQDMESIRESPEVELSFDRLQSGDYQIEWWDTQKGEMIRSETGRCNGALQLTIPSLRTDVAVRIFPSSKEPERPTE